MKTDERPLADRAHPYWTAPRDTWLIARVPVLAVYPCRCTVDRRCDPRRCPCSGRVDSLDQMPTVCCARRAYETRRRAGESEDR